MSAEESGRGLLSKVEVEGLDELLSSLRALQHSDVSNHFGIPELDALMPVVEALPLPEPQSRRESWMASTSRTVQGAIPKKTLIKPPAIELLSTAPGGGKTHLLYYITTIAVLPATFQGANFCGKNSAVIVLDADGRFDVPRLAKVMTGYISSKVHEHSDTSSESPDPTKSLRKLITTSLAHVHIFRPQSHDSLVATLEGLSTYLFDSAAHPSSHRPIHSILLDSGSAFYWNIRANASHSTSKYPVIDAYATLTRHLTELSRTLSCAVIASSWSFAQTQSGSMRSSIPGPAWSQFINVRLVVRRVPVAPFAANVSVEEAWTEKQQREEVVRRERFEVWKLGGTWDGEGFGFKVVEDGVWIERGR